MTITEMHHVTAGMLSQKPHLGPKVGRPPKSAIARAASRWHVDEKSVLMVRCASDKVFPGQYYDQETNLFYNWNRYYDPQLGRYITSDPIGLGGGSNTYLYADANVMIEIDKLGLTGPSASSVLELFHLFEMLMEKYEEHESEEREKIKEMLEQRKKERVKELEEKLKYSEEQISGYDKALESAGWTKYYCDSNCQKKFALDKCYDLEKCLKQCFDDWDALVKEYLNSQKIFRRMKRDILDELSGL